MKTPKNPNVIRWCCPKPVDIHVPAPNHGPQSHRASPSSDTQTIRGGVNPAKQLPHGALVHFRGRVGQVVVVSAAVERQ